MGDSYQLPVERTESARVGRRLYRKQVLRLGKLQHKGDTLDFTTEYLQALVDSFNDGAFDQVPFMLTDEANRHTMDPERFRGEIKALAVTPTGLDALIELTDDGAKIVEDNPSLGVSARIVPDLEHADGRKYTAALQHVLGTHDPVVTRMGAWQPVSLANEPNVIDLTAATYEGDPLMPNEPNTATGNAPAADPEELTDEQLEQLLAEMVAADKDAAAVAPGVAPVAPAPDPALASLSAEQRQATELARQQATELAAVRMELDDQKFEREKAELLARGVPPAIVELARPSLLGSGLVTTDLARGQTVDHGAVMRAVLKGYEGSVPLGPEQGGNYPLNNYAAGQGPIEDALLEQLTAMGS
jgi:hypothetical protein